MRRVRPNEVEMPFLDHLEELRWRIIYSLAAEDGVAILLAPLLLLRARMTRRAVA